MARSRKFTRRQFLQTAGAVAGGVALYNSLPSCAAVPTAAAGGLSVNIVFSPADPVASSPQAQWAIGYLRQALMARGVAIRPEADLTISAEHSAALTVPEQFSLIPGNGGRGLIAAASNPLGLVYALTELADRVQYATDVRAALTLPAAVTETPANRIRGIFRMFASEVEDRRWYYDREGWQKYLDMLVTHRFNRVNLSFGLTYDFSTNVSDTYTFFMYPFFVDVPGYKVRAIAKNGQPLPADEMKKNLDTLKYISDQAALRGIKFTLGIWTHSYRWTNSPNATHNIEGLDAQTQAPYSRDAMKIIIDACPGITGITLRTHGESGVPEGSYDLWKVIMSGIMGHKNPDGTNRPIELDLHGKTMTQEMIDTAMTTGQPIIISCKLWAEHKGLPYVQASIRESEMPHRDGTGLMALSSGSRNFLRYGIGDLLSKDRKYQVMHRVWPGTQKLLLWGDPQFAAGYSRTGGFAGMDGIDFFEPMSFRGRAGSSMNIPPAPDRSGYADDSLRAPHDWEKYAYIFRLWGRLSYHPDAAPETWQRQLKSDYGAAATSIETALANTSRILPLLTTAHLCAASNASYWPELYVNLSLHNPAGSPYSEIPTPRVFGNVSPLDPQMFASVNEYVDSLLAGKALAKVNSLEVSRQLDAWSAAALAALADADKIDADRPAARAAAVRRAQIDATINAGLGLFFAHKFRAAILWQLFNLSGHEPARAAATDAYKKARDAWAKLADTGKVYISNLTYGGSACLHGHWADRLPAIDRDIADMATRQPSPRENISAATIDKLIALVTNPIRPATEAVARQHTPPANFTPGKAVALELRTNADSVSLYYRHLHQGQRYVALDMQKQGATFTAQIPADYTNSAFPLQYYFEIHAGDQAAVYPGFQPNFTGTPYFVVLQA
jgi:hypothetical protein